MDEKMLMSIVERVVRECMANQKSVEDIPVGVSNRHIHLSKADLAAEAKEYVLSLGLTEAEVAALMTNLGADVGEPVPPTGDPIMQISAVMMLALAATVAILPKRKEN